VTSTKYVDAYRARHRAAGLCLECSEPALPESPLCARHLVRQRKRMRKSRGCDAQADSGIGRPPLVPDTAEHAPRRRR
jgi:hypothetical protein